MKKGKIVGFIIKEDNNDYTLWSGEFTHFEQELLSVIAKAHETDGDSVRGDSSISVKDVCPLSKGEKNE